MGGFPDATLPDHASPSVYRRSRILTYLFGIMKATHTTPLLAAILALSAPAIHARQPGDDKQAIIQQQPASAPVGDDEWRFSFTPYFWLPSVDLDLNVPIFSLGGRTIGGGFDIDQPWWDTLSAFDSDNYLLSIDGRFEAWKGDWGGFVDGYWIFGRTLQNNSDTFQILRNTVTITAASSVTNRFETGQINFGPQYRIGTAPLGETSSVHFILYGGGRVNWVSYDLDGTLDLSATSALGTASTQGNFGSSNDRLYIEPMIGLKTIWLIGDCTVLTLRGDVGGFGWVENDNWDCDLEASVGWEVGTGVLLSVGYRARGQWEDAGSGNEITAEGWFHGPEVGVTWRF